MDIRAWLGAHSPYLILLVPAAVVVLTVLSRRLFRGDRWRRSDFYLGPALSLSGFGAACYLLFDLYRAYERGETIDLLHLTWYVPFSAILMGIVFALHVTWEKEDGSRYAQIFWLIAVSNVIGAVAWLAFLLVVKS